MNRQHSHKQSEEMPKENFKRLVEETKNLNLAIIKERESKEVRIVQIGQRISKREEQIEQLRNNTKVYLDDVISHLIYLNQEDDKEIKRLLEDIEKLGR